MVMGFRCFVSSTEEEEEEEEVGGRDKVSV